MADGQIDTSIYRDAVAQNPLEVAGQVVDYRNKLLNNQQQQQQVQANSIKLATERFGMINNAASGLLQDPDLGRKDVTSKLWDTLGRLTKGDAMSAAHAVQFMQQFPSDPKLQPQAIKAVHAQTLDAWQKGQAYLGQTEGLPVGGGTKFIGKPAFGGGPVQDRGYVANTLQPGTTTPNADLSQSYVGGTGNPPVQLPVNNPATQATGWRREPTVNAQTGAPMPQGAGSIKPEPILASPAPGAAAPLEASGAAYAKDLADSRTYAERVTPLRQAIPLLEKLGKTGTGPGTETIQHIKSFAQSMGLPVPNDKAITDYAEAKKYLEQNRTAAAPPGTNVPGVMGAIESNPNMQQPNRAAVDLSKTLLALARLKQASVLAFKETGLPANKYTEWASDWSKSQDPRAYGADLMSPENRDSLRKAIKPGSEQAKKFRASVDTAQKLGLFGDVDRPEAK